MRSISIKKALLVAAFAGASVVMASGGADAAKGSRDAAIAKCFAEARGSTDIVPGGAGGETRAAVYKDCMLKAGYRP